MSPEAQEIAMAQVAGWHGIRSGNKATAAGPIGMLKPLRTYQHLPDYLGNLNATMEVASALAKEGWKCMANMGTDGTWECFFTQSFSDEIIPSKGDHYGAGDTLAMALVEAILRVKGLWREATSTETKPADS